MKNKVVTCCCCGQVLPPKVKFLGPNKQRIYDYVAAHPEGVGRQRLAEYVYEDVVDGGPENAYGSISVLICLMNRTVLREHGLRIKGRGGPGSTYTLQQI
jgi:hypothetical protein